MGGVCAKNDAGRVATDAPKANIKRQEKTLQSMQGLPGQETESDQYDSKYVEATINFNVDKGVDKKSNDLAFETANAWCAMDLNAGWTYTGVWKTEASKDDPEKMVSLFQVRKKKERLEMVENLDEENKTGGKKDDINVQEVGKVDDGKRPAVDQKQSFVDQVAEGLAAKLPPDRFVKDGESSPSGEEQRQDTKDTSDTKGQAADSDSKESPAAANNEEEKKAEDDDAPNEKTDTSASKAAENADRKKSETISESNIVEGLGSTTEDK